MPRPSSRPTGAVWRLLEEWQTEHPLRPNQSQMARLFGISGSLLSNWKYADSLMQTDDIALVAEKTGIEFSKVAAAAAEDAPTARAAAARRRQVDVTVTNEDGSVTLIEAKTSAQLASDFESLSPEARSYVVALLAVGQVATTAQALNERLEEGRRVDPALAREARNLLVHTPARPDMVFDVILTKADEDHVDPFDLHLTADDRVFLHENRVGSPASLSARSGRPDLAIAADEQESSIAGEQEQPTEP